MAKVTRYTNRDEDEDGRGGRRPARQTGSPILPLAILLGMIIGAVILARAFVVKKEEEPVQAAPADTGPKPFEDYVEEAPTPREPRARGGNSKPPAPPGLADSNPDWARAVAMADEAAVLFSAAQKAKANDETTLFLEKAKRSKEMYDEAAILTAVWEEELLDQYNERDKQVKAITSARTKWLDRVRYLHKSTGR